MFIGHRTTSSQHPKRQMSAESNKPKKTSKNYHSPSLILIFTPSLQHLSAENDTYALVWGIQLFPVALSGNPINPVTPTSHQLHSASESLYMERSAQTDPW